MLYWITTESGEKYHITTNAGLRGAETMGSFVSLNDLQNLTARGVSILQAGSGGSEHLQMCSEAQKIISPADGDKWTGTQHILELAGIKLDVSLRPTGGNFYYGGSGGFQLLKRDLDHDYSTSLPGWAWWWVCLSVLTHYLLEGVCILMSVGQSDYPRGWHSCY
jgi:hypothetical protein